MFGVCVVVWLVEVLEGGEEVYGSVDNIVQNPSISSKLLGRALQKSLAKMM